MSGATSNIETEYLELNVRNAWPALFQHIRNESAKYEYGCSESLKPQNKALNRYRDVSPFDHSRIILNRGPCDYINANLVQVEKSGRKYILTQGPLAETVGAFWLMVWEQKSKAVLMLNKIVEKKQVKCHWYWPQSIGPEHALILNDVGLKVEYLENRDRSHWTERIFKVTDITQNENPESREVLQFHYTTWPDFGVPSSPNAFLEFLRAVRNSGSLEETVGPAIVHCSAGIGRSGTFCLVDSCLILIEREGLNSVSVREILLEMRKYRMGLIQTPDQLRFSYQAIIEGAKKSLSNSENGDLSDSNSEVEEIASEDNNSEDDEPPPLPPPRNESLKMSQNIDEELEIHENGPEKPLPTIPASESLSELNNVNDNRISKSEIFHENSCENSKKLDLSLDTSSEINSPEKSSQSPSSPNSELRHRLREERKEKLSAQIKDMKRKQVSAEQWTEFKRSVCKNTPVILFGAAIFSCGFIAFYYFKS